MLSEDLAHVAPLVEFGEAPEFYVSGIGAIARMDGNLRLTLFAWVLPAGGIAAERRVRCHVVMATAAVEAALRETQAFLTAALSLAH